jgi:hypothetical protein
MTSDSDDIFNDPFHGCAFAAFVEQAHAEQGWPDIEATRRLAYAYFEQQLAIRNRRPR